MRLENDLKNVVTLNNERSINDRTTVRVTTACCRNHGKFL